jgi:hypothetical protein
MAKGTLSAWMLSTVSLKRFVDTSAIILDGYV